MLQNEKHNARRRLTHINHAVQTREHFLFIKDYYKDRGNRFACSFETDA